MAGTVDALFETAHLTDIDAALRLALPDPPPTGPPMSMNPDSHKEIDLDRTDELPRLDVAAYEASLAAAEADALSRTDTWAVEALQQREAAETEAVDIRSATLLRTRLPAEPGSPAVTNDVDRILRRIHELEGEIDGTGALNRELELRCDSLDSERATLEKRILTLEADHARLTEYREIALENIDRLEQQLLDQSAQHGAQLAEIATTRSQEHSSTTSTRVLLESRIAQDAARLADLNDDHGKLERQLHAASTLAELRAQSIADLERALADSQKAAASLGHNLAVKLAEQDAASATVQRRNSTIAALQTMRDDLSEQLQQTIAKSETLALRLAETNAQVDDQRSRIDALGRDLTDRDQRIASLEATVARLTGELTATSQERNATQDALSVEREHQTQAQTSIEAQLREITELRNALSQSESNASALQRDLHATNVSLDKERGSLTTLKSTLSDEQQQLRAARAELDEAQIQIDQLASERDELIAIRDQFTTQSAELAATGAELAGAQAKIAALATELATHASLVSARDQELAAAQQTNSRVHQHLDDVQLDASQLRQTLARLQTETAEQAARLQDRTAELAAARREQNEAATTIHGLEQAVRAREELADNLRGELQTAQDERGIMAVQLDKVRSRTKQMAQEIFQRDSRIVTLKSELAVHTEALAAIRRDVGRVGGDPEGIAEEPIERILEPVDHSGPSIVLDRKIMTIGRTEDNDVCIPSKLVSRHHARLLVGPNAVIVEDAGSTNGCYVNDREVKQHAMRDGDVLILGELKYRLCSVSPNNTRIRSNVVQLPPR
jgi:chromosome segregation ATPase